jgi:hypothetical protein
METNRILEEVWRAKDELDRDAAHDLHQLCENTRAWAAKHPHVRPPIQSLEDLRGLVEMKKAQHPESSAMALNDSPLAK